MNANENFAKLDVRTIISTLWIFVMFNMIFADIVGFVAPGQLEQIINGETGFDITQELLLVFAVLLEIPIAMVFLSRILSRRVSQWANTIAAVVTAIFIIVGGSAYLHYYFFASMEIAAMGLIVWYAWTWPTEVDESLPEDIVFAKGELGTA